MGVGDKSNSGIITKIDSLTLLQRRNLVPILHDMPWEASLLIVASNANNHLAVSRAAKWLLKVVGLQLGDTRVLIDEESSKIKTCYFDSQESHQDRQQGLKKTNIEHSRS